MKADLIQKVVVLVDLLAICVYNVKFSGGYSMFMSLRMNLVRTSLCTNENCRKENSFVSDNSEVLML